MNGCLVTDEVSFDYEEKNVPPVIVDVKGTNTLIGDIIYFGVESPATITFEFRVRDENLNQTLLGRRKISRQRNQDFISQEYTETFGIAPSGEPYRYFSLNINQDSFESDACYRIDIAISSAFKYPSDDIRYRLWYWDMPEDEDDIAKARWYVVTGEEAKCQYATKYE